MHCHSRQVFDELKEGEMGKSNIENLLSSKILKNHEQPLCDASTNGGDKLITDS
jgi:hypothetical protein